MHFWNPLAKKRIYLDWAASAPTSRTARHAFSDALHVFGNPSSPHEEGLRAKQLLEGARTQIARLAEVKSEGVVFTSGATEANNLALVGHAMALREAGVPARDIHILYAPGAHASIMRTIERLASYGMRTEQMVIKDGTLDIERLNEQLTSQTRLVALEGVCGETGMRFPTRDVRTILDAYARKHGSSRILLHVDASQVPLVASYALSHLGADTLTLDAQKVGGVRGCGALCMRQGIPLTPLFSGGGQEGGRRPGGEPVALAIAFAAALTEAQRGRERFLARAQHVRQELIARLRQELPNMLVNEGREQVPHIVNLSFPGVDTDYLVALLDQEGFAVSTKSACESGSEDGSRAVRALTNDEARAQATLRLSWGPTTRPFELRQLATALIRSIRFMDANSLY